MDVKEKVKQMAQYCDVEGIADALKITPEVVQAILDGKDVEIEEKLTETNQQIIQVKTTTMVHRQKIIAVWRAKGGVGTTVLAMTLARQMSEIMKVVLLDLNFAEGGSDILYYLDMPFYPQAKLPAENIWDGVHEVQDNLYIMQPITHLGEQIQPEQIQELIINARQEFDAVIIDLPNSQEEYIMEAARNANNLVLVMSNTRQEGYRLAKLSSMFPGKNQVLVANMGLKEKAARAEVPVEQVVTIPFDKTLDEKLDKQIPVSVRSPFYQGVTEIYEAIFAEEFEKVPEGKFSEFIYSIRVRYKRMKKLSPMGNIRNMLGTVWGYAENLLWALATITVIVVALDNYTDVNIPFAHDVLNKVATTINSILESQP